ncbi:MAG: hypothetical protein WBA12_06075, partial [Catalinimonas sp.]
YLDQTFADAPAEYTAFLHEFVRELHYKEADFKQAAHPFDAQAFCCVLHRIKGYPLPDSAQLFARVHLEIYGHPAPHRISRLEVEAWLAECLAEIDTIRACAERRLRPECVTAQTDAAA